MLFAYVVIFSVTGVLIGFGSAESTVGSWHHERVRVAVIDRDASPLSSALKEQLLSDNDAQELADDRRAIQDAVAKDSCSYVLVIPQGWGGGDRDPAPPPVQRRHLPPPFPTVPIIS